MKEIPLTQGKIALVSDEDFAKVSAFKWSAYRAQKTWYARRSVMTGMPLIAKQYTQMMHRFILDVTDNRILVDHRDWDGLNNQRHNLRISNKTQNNGNARKRVDGHSSKYRGVSRAAGGWAAAIGINGKRVSLGFFRDEEQAAKAYDKAAIEYFGEFARPNFPAWEAQRQEVEP